MLSLGLISLPNRGREKKKKKKLHVHFLQFYFPNPMESEVPDLIVEYNKGDKESKYICFS